MILKYLLFILLCLVIVFNLAVIIIMVEDLLDNIKLRWHRSITYDLIIILLSALSISIAINSIITKLL